MTQWPPALHVIEVGQPLRQGNAPRFQDADIISTFIYSWLDKDLLDRLGTLKAIATRSTGFDHIDTAYCESRGITICNVPSYAENTVAHHVLLRMRNVIVTPHSAFNTREAVEQIVATTVENNQGFLSGTPQNVIAGPHPTVLGE